MLKKIIILIILMLFTYGGFKFVESDFFLIRKINILSENQLIQTDILNKLTKFKKQSIIFVDTREIKNILEKDVRIEEVNISKKYPDILNIDIIEEKPIAITEYKNRYFYVNKNFVIFAYYNELKDENLPIINLPSEENIEDFKIILKQVFNSKMYNYISEIYEKDKKYYFILIDGTLVYTNKDVKEKKYNYAFDIYNEEIKNRNLEYIDLRFRDIIVK